MYHELNTISICSVTIHVAATDLGSQPVPSPATHVGATDLRSQPVPSPATHVGATDLRSQPVPSPETHVGVSLLSFAFIHSSNWFFLFIPLVIPLNSTLTLSLI